MCLLCLSKQDSTNNCFTFERFPNKICSISVLTIYRLICVWDSGWMANELRSLSKIDHHMKEQTSYRWVCLKIVHPIVPNGFHDHCPVFKWLYIIGNINPTFSDKPRYLMVLADDVLSIRCLTDGHLSDTLTSQVRRFLWDLETPSMTCFDQEKHKYPVQKWWFTG